MHYSPEYKRTLAEQCLSQPDRSVDDIARDSNVSRASLFRWIKIYGPSIAGLERKTIKPVDWSMAQRLRALLECQGLTELELGEYLRRQGLYFSDLARWRAEILDEVKKDRRSNQIPSSEASYLKRIRELERELQIKEKALKEATALIALKKKAESIWGDRVDEKSGEPNEKSAKFSSKRRPKKEPG